MGTMPSAVRIVHAVQELEEGEEELKGADDVQGNQKSFGTACESRNARPKCAENFQPVSKPKTQMETPTVQKSGSETPWPMGSTPCTFFQRPALKARFFESKGRRSHASGRMTSPARGWGHMPS